MVRPIEEAPIFTPPEEVAVCASHKVLMEVDDNILLIVVNPQGISNQQFCLYPIHLINIIITIIKINYILFNYLKT
jgi:hypothetical protein